MFHGLDMGVMGQWVYRFKNPNAMLDHIKYGSIFHIILSYLDPLELLNNKCKARAKKNKKNILIKNTGSKLYNYTKKDTK